MLAVFVIVLLLQGEATALREQRLLVWKGDASAAGTLAVTRDEQWGFEAGARIEVTLLVKSADPTNPRAPILFLRMFTGSQWSTMTAADYQPPDLMCLEPGVLRMEVTGSRATMNVTVQQQGNFVLAVQLCTPEPTSVLFDVVFWNPVGTHLSVQQQPLLDVYSVMMLLYGFVVWQWLIMLIQHRTFTIKFHWFLLAAASLKLVEMTSLFIHMGELRREGKVSSTLVVYVRGISAVAETAQLLVEGMLCMTWSIYRLVFNTHEYYLSVLAGLSFVIFRVMYAFCGHAEYVDKTNSTVMCSLYLITYYVVKFLIEFGMLVALTQNVERLTREIFVDDTATLLSMKLLQRLRHVRVVYGTSIVTPFVLVFFRFSVLSWRSEWVSTVIYEGIVWLAYVFIGGILRPNP